MKNGSAIVRSISGIEVTQRSIDGYVSATQLLKAYEAKTGVVKKLSNWTDTEKAKSYIALVASKVGIPTFDLIHSSRGSKGGSWLHPKLAVSFAAWLDVEFEYQVSEWVQEWMKTGQNPVTLQSMRAQVLATMIPEAPLTWECRYTPIFWERLQFLYGYSQENRVCAKWINRYVYNYFPQDVRDRLNEVNPLIDGKRKGLQHCHFDGELLAALELHLTAVINFMIVAKTAKSFEEMMLAKFKGIQQLQFEEMLEMAGSNHDY